MTQENGSIENAQKNAYIGKINDLMDAGKVQNIAAKMSVQQAGKE